MNRIKISDIASEVSIRINNPSLSGYDKFVGLEHYVSGEMKIKKFGGTELLESSMKEFKSGDTLVARRNVYLKRASMVDFDGVTSGDSIVLRAKNKVFERLLPFILNTDDFWKFAEKNSDGTMSKRLSPKLLMQYEFNLPDDDKLSSLADVLWGAVQTKDSYQNLVIRTAELVKSQFIGQKCRQNVRCA